MTVYDYLLVHQHLPSLWMPLVPLIISPYCPGSLPHLFPGFVLVRFGEPKAPVIYLVSFLSPPSFLTLHIDPYPSCCIPIHKCLGFSPALPTPTSLYCFLLILWTPLLGLIWFPTHPFSQIFFMNHLALLHAVKAQMPHSLSHLMLTGSNCMVRRIQQGHITPAICYSYRWKHLCHWIPAYLLQGWNPENSSSFWQKQKFWEARSQAQVGFSSPGKAPFQQMVAEPAQPGGAPWLVRVMCPSPLCAKGVATRWQSKFNISDSTLTLAVKSTAAPRFSSKVATFIFP